MAAKLNKRCRVCGDVAYAFNFSGLSCEACKAFFRRNYKFYNSEVHRCTKGGQCAINMATRNNCKSCRLLKCIQIGMKMELVTKAELETTALNDFGNEQDNEIKLETFHLQAYQIVCIHEVNDAMRLLATGTNHQWPPFPGNFRQIITLAERIAQRMVVAFSQLCAFRALHRHDQIVLLKAVFAKLVAVCAAFKYNDSSKTQSYMCKLLLKSEPKMARTMDDFLRSLNEIIQGDVTLKNLIIAHLLFTHRHNICFPEYLRYQSTFYWHLLYRYLLQKHQNREQTQIMCTELGEMFMQMERVIKILHQVYLQQTDPLTIAQILVAIYKLL